MPYVLSHLWTPDQTGFSRYHGVHRCRRNRCEVTRRRVDGRWAYREGAGQPYRLKKRPPPCLGVTFKSERLQGAQGSCDAMGKVGTPCWCGKCFTP